MTYPKASELFGGHMHRFVLDMGPQKSFVVDGALSFMFEFSVINIRPKDSQQVNEALPGPGEGEGGLCFEGTVLITWRE